MLQFKKYIVSIHFVYQRMKCTLVLGKLIATIFIWKLPNCAVDIKFPSKKIKNHFSIQTKCLEGGGGVQLTT